MSRRARAVATALALAIAAGLAAQETPVHYVAFGDSITFGVGDDPARAEAGYPPRLVALLAARGQNAVVDNQGLPGETTGEGLARLDGVLDQGGDTLLLMEGTNDIGLRVSPETIQFNLAQMAARAAVRGMSTVHITVIPRLPAANFDGNNRVTGELAGLVRELAWQNQRRLADAFEVFGFETPNAFADFYGGGQDHLHPNAAGYDLLARTLADTLTGVDTLPPVPGRVAPGDDEQGVASDAEIQVDLYDFGAGIDLSATQLVVDDLPVDALLTGDEHRAELRYMAPGGLSGVVMVGVRSRDLAQPPHELDRHLVQFVTEGTTFLTGDIDRDGRVDGLDLVAFAVRFGSVEGDGRYRLFADFNGDGVVDGEDLARLAANFGRSSV